MTSIVTIATLALACEAASSAADAPAKSVSPPGQTIQRTRAQIRDRIHGAWAGMLIGGIEGLAHEFKYIDEPRKDLPQYALLPNGARSDDDNDFEWTHLYFMDKEGTFKIPYPRLTEIWKANMNEGIWCANLQARKLMDQDLRPPQTSDPKLNSFASYNLIQIDGKDGYRIRLQAPRMLQPLVDTH